MNKRIAPWFRVMLYRGTECVQQSDVQGLIPAKLAAIAEAREPANADVTHIDICQLVGHELVLITRINR